MTISYIVNNLFFFYFVLIILRVLLSWFPNIEWFTQPYKTLSLLTDSYLNLFKKIIPPIGMIDISPIIAIIVLQLIQQVVVRGLVSVGL